MPASFTLAQREAMQVAATWAGIRVRAVRLTSVPALLHCFWVPAAIEWSLVIMDSVLLQRWARNSPYRSIARGLAGAARTHDLQEVVLLLAA